MRLVGKIEIRGKRKKNEVGSFGIVSSRVGMGFDSTAQPAPILGLLFFLWITLISLAKIKAYTFQFLILTTSYW